MPQYGILIYSPAPADPMAITPDYLELLDRYPAQVEELGGQIVTGFALQPSTTATAIRADVVTTDPSSRPRRSSPGSTSWRRPIWTSPCGSPSSTRPPGTAASKSGRCSSRRPSERQRRRRYGRGRRATLVNSQAR